MSQEERSNSNISPDTSIVPAGAIPTTSIIESEVNANKMKRFVKTLDECYRSLMTKDTDYGTIPGTCLSGSTKIVTNPHGEYEISSIDVGAKVYTMNNDGQISPKRVIERLSNGIQPVYEVNIKGRTIKATLNHPFLVACSINQRKGRKRVKRWLEWKQLQDIHVGDLVVISRHLPGYPTDLSLDFVRLLGFLYGDGWVSKCGGTLLIGFAKGMYQENNRKYCALIQNVFGLSTKEDKKSRVYYALSKKIGQNLRDVWGLDKHAKTKRIPTTIFSLPIEHRKAFVEGFCDADGCCKTKTGEWSIEISNKDLIEDIKRIIETVGWKTSSIRTRSRMLKPPSLKEPRMFTSYALSFLKKEYKFGGRPHSERYNELVDFNDFLLFPVKSIKYAGQEEVFDIMVEESHNFIANNILVHNSKPTLYKPGAEILCAAFNLRAETEIVSKVEDYDTPFFDYTVKVTLYSRRDGQKMGDGVGSANTGETRYARRYDKRAGGQRDATRDEIMTLKNTVLKMAEKRGFIDSTLRVTSASRIFTQDVEDLKGAGLEDLEDDSPPRPEDIKQATPIPQSQKPTPSAQTQPAASKPPTQTASATQKSSFGKSASVSAPAPQPPAPQSQVVAEAKPVATGTWYNLKWTANKLVGFPIKKADGPIYYQFIKDTLSSSANASGFNVQFIIDEDDSEIKKILTTEMDEGTYEEIVKNLQLSLSNIFKCRPEEVSVQVENYTTSASK